MFHDPLSVPSPLPVDDEPPSGQMKKRVGRYELLRKIGAGGMAHVYEARDLEGDPESTVAIKVVRPDLTSDPGIVAMFLDEARLGARLRHPNLCPVYAVGEVNQTLYIVMELLRGRSVLELGRRMRRCAGWFDGSESIQVACATIALAARGLHAIHEACGPEGLPLMAVHRDISPQNLFMTVDGSVRVLDLGVARFRTRTHTTQVGTTKGKYLYMAPEQLYCSNVDRRADVWALGACLHELLVGQRLFSAETQRLKAERARAPIPRVSALRDGVPPALEAVLDRALAYRPEERTASARQLGLEVERFLDRPAERILRRFMVSEAGAGHLLKTCTSRRSYGRGIGVGAEPGTPAAKEVASTRSPAHLMASQIAPVTEFQIDAPSPQTEQIETVRMDLQASGSAPTGCPPPVPEPPTRAATFRKSSYFRALASFFAKPPI